MPAHAPLPRPRTAGILLHPTSLPGPYGVGDLGPAARAWVDLLARAGQTWWQVLPLNPPGAGDSPYSAFSAFAGNPLLVSPDDLAADGLLRTDELEAAPLPAGPVNYPLAAAAKNRLLTRAWERFRDGAAPELLAEYTKFAASAEWLEDYALFTAIKETVPAGVWTDWPAGLVARDPAALDRARTDLADAVARERFAQFCFARQLAALRGYAAARGVKLLGDMPIFISGDSADLWAAPHLFDLDADRRPRVVAGVPPDYFAADGQHWGNPLYDWDRMAATGYAWWAARLRRQFAQVDFIRLDHFRGFAAAWHIPAGEKTAINGRWVPGPGRKFFDRLAADLGSLPVLAEDLGVITKDVDDLRIGLGLPGMRVLQFMLGSPDNPYWPHNFETNTAVYTGTHDNDTSNGWYAKLDDGQRWQLGEYLGRAVPSAAWELIRLAWSSVAVLAIAPAQDLLDLGGDCRMNTPGVAAGNWGWRIAPQQWKPDAIQRLATLTYIYDRDPNVARPAKA